MDTMVTFKDQSLSEMFLSEEQIRKVCPYAYLTSPSNEVSEKYMMVTTSTIISDMEKLGWGVVEAKQRKSQKGKETSRFSYHMVVFQNPNVKITKKVEGQEEEVVDSYPRIILTNSSDGFNSFKFMAGLFRVVCSNGMVIADSQVESFSIRHVGYEFEELRAIVNKAVEELPQRVENINKMDSVILTEEQKRDLAKKAYQIRKGTEAVVDEELITELLTPKRPEDEGSSLWHVLNTLQEKVIKGGFKAPTKNNKLRAVRGLKNFAEDLRVNRKLWQEAEVYMAAA